MNESWESDVLRPTAATLFEKFADTTQKLFEATDNLSVLGGQDEAFAEGEKHADEMSAKCRVARRALEQHWKEHRCRVQQTPTE